MVKMLDSTKAMLPISIGILAAVVPTLAIWWANGHTYLFTSSAIGYMLLFFLFVALFAAIGRMTPRARHYYAALSEFEKSYRYEEEG